MEYTESEQAQLEKLQEKQKQLKEREKQIKARAATKKRKEETRQKIILGGLLMKKARTVEKTKQWLLNTIETEVTREADKKTLASLVDELKASNPSTATESTQKEPDNTADAKSTSSFFSKS